MYIDVSLERVDSILILLKQNKINSIYCTLHNVLKRRWCFVPSIYLPNDREWLVLLLNKNVKSWFQM